jgi:methionine-rich copper-binding protein CopC
MFFYRFLNRSTNKLSARTRRCGGQVMESLESRQLLAVNPVVLENALPGTPQTEWYIAGDGDTSIQGYATDISVDQGGTVNFKVNDPSLAPYRLDIYRMGYYQGNGARKVATVPASQTVKVNQPAPLSNAATGLTDAGNWSVTASWAVPANATSGIYFANVTREDTGGFSQIIFIVRDDDGQSDMLFQTSDSTWQAYNAWGGRSMYITTVGGTRAQKVSYNRPFTTRSATPMGRDFLFGPEFAMVRFLEANGYDVSYFTNVDTARRGAEIKEHRTFLSVGHDEYWSGEMRANVEAARDSGVSLAFFSGNEVYWKVRWENAISADGTPYRTMVCYKETNSDSKIDPSPEWTGTWRDPRFSPPSNGGRPENALTGTIFSVNRGPGGETGTPMSVPAEFGNLRFWRNTSVANLAAGQTATLGDIVLGYEWDEDLDNGFRPAGLIRMSSTSQTVPEKLLDYGSTVGIGPATHNLTLYRAPSGALVFGAGTVQWSYGLDGTHDGIQTTPDPAMRQATVNLFGDMGIQPAALQAGLVPALPSTDVVAPTATITSPVGGANLRAGTPVTITGTASDVGGVVGGVEISTDSGLTWHRAEGRNSWSYTWVPSVVGPTTLMARAADDSGNIQSTSAGVAVTVQTQPTSTTGLVGAWGFNATSGTVATDNSGLGNNGTVSGATWVTGLFGNGLQFNGTSDWVTVPDANSLDLTTGMTLEAWVKPTAAASGWSTVMLKERTGGFGYALYAFDDANKPPAGYIRVGSDRAARGITTLPVNQWTHLTATYGPDTTVRLYVNGELAGSLLTDGSITTSSLPLRFGGNAQDGEFFTGVLDNIRIYNRALNAGEIKVDMSTPVGGAIETTPPFVSISSPANGNSIAGVKTISIGASDNVAVAAVEVLVNGQLLGTATRTGPFSFATTWDTTKVSNGSYSITARAKDFAGNVTLSPAVNVTVSNPADLTAPVVLLRYPLAGSKVTGLVPVWATASDNINVVGVQFKLNGANLGAEDTTQPFRMAFDTSTVASGTYTLTAVARDAAGNITTSNAMTFDVDNVAPAVVSRTPAAGATNVSPNTTVVVTFSEDVNAGTISFNLRNAANQLVAGSLAYDAPTRTATFTPSSALALGAQYSVTVSGAQDGAGNVMAPATWSFTSSSTVIGATIWKSNVTPASASEADGASIEVGLRFRANINGYITGIRFYKGAGNTGAHVGHLWTNAGAQLASVTFTDETASGWQQANFTTPVQVTAGVTYVVSYYAPLGHYAANPGYFATSGFDGGTVQALRDGFDGANGVYRYVSGGGFPSSTFNSTNYWVDVVFSNSLVDATPPSVAARSPAVAAVDVPVGANITATFSEAVTPASISMVLRDAANNVIPGVLSYDAATLTATLNPNADLAFSSAYSVTVSGATDAAGNVMAPVTWSFTTYAPDVTPPVIQSRTPAPGSTVAPATTLAVQFNESVQAPSISLRVLDQNNADVPATLSYNDANHTVTFNPQPPAGRPPGCCGNCSHCPLNPATTYQVILSGVQDVAGNTMATQSWSFTTDPLIDNASLWSGTTTPAVVSVNDFAGVELGVKFQANTLGFVSGIRFYKGASNTGIHVGHLWDGNGVLLATATFENESPTGWQEVRFNGSWLIQPNTTYIASYYAPNGGYSVNTGYFTSAGYVNGPLSAPSNAASGGNGVYAYGTSGIFPNSTGSGSNYWVDVIFSNAIVADTTAPTVVSKSPAAGSTGAGTGTNISATFSEAVTFSSVTMTVRDASNAVVPGTGSYDSATRTFSFDPVSPLNFSASYSVSLSGATDLAGNVMAPVAWSFTTTAPVVNATIWAPSSTPATASVNDSAAVELGVKFRATADGYITGIRFYKGAGNTGTHTGHLWTSTGTLLATATFFNESATGWQQANFDSPVAVTSGTTYVASYYAPVGRYSANGAYFSNSVTNGPLTALGTGIDGGNGVYRYGTGGGFPASTYNSTNYWVDVVYNSLPDDVAAPIVTQTSPLSAATGVAASSNITATFNEPVQAGTISIVLRDSANSVVPGVVSYNSTTRTVTLNPNVDLAGGATYSVTVSGAADAGDNVMAPVTWSFTTQAAATAGTIWGPTATPATESANDGAALEIGVKFRSSANGYITGIRFYKGAGNTGTHVGHLWSSTGTLLATITFTGEGATGWQQANFDSPVAITAGQTYVASYYTPVGHYALTSAYFASSGTTSGALTALGDGVDGGNGVYRYGTGGGFPSNSSGASNYWVDVVFNPNPVDVVPPAVASASPASGATGVATSTNISAMFTESVQPATISLILRDSGGNAVAGAVTYDAATKTVTLDPTANLVPAATYSVTLSGAADASGNVMTSVNWLFTTRDNVWQQTTSADFATGAATGTEVLSTGDIALATAATEDFNGTALAAGYDVTSWASDGGGPASVAVAGGILSIQGAQVLAPAPFSNAGVEGRLSFGVTPFQYFGIATGFASFAGNYWAIFATDSGDVLKARVNSNGTTQEVSLGLQPTGFHVYRVTPVATGFDFYIDGQFRTNVPLSFPAGQTARAALSAFTGSPQPALQADWMRVLSYVPTGTFESSIFDAGSTVQWTTASWVANLPPATGLVVETSTSDSVGGPWSSYTAVTNGQISSPASRYIRYRVRLTSGNTALTPSLSEITIRWA